MKDYIIASASSLLRLLSLLLRGYVFGSRFARFEFRRSFLRPWLDTLGMVGAWVFLVLGCAAAFAALWGLLWLGYILGFTM